MDHPLDALRRAQFPHERAYLAQVPLVQVAAAQHAAQPCALPVVGRPPGLGQQRGGALGAHVVQALLAGVLRIAEEAEQVVAELERLAEGQTVRGVGVPQSLTGAGQQAADEQGVFDGVLGGLVPDHLQ